MTEVNPFAALELTPTLDAVVVKRGYFAMLAKHPPHADPDGFGRVRAAYEALTRPGGLAAAYAATGVDVEAELALWRQRFGARIGAAADAFTAVERQRRAAEDFVDNLSRRSLGEARLWRGGAA